MMRKNYAKSQESAFYFMLQQWWRRRTEVFANVNETGTLIVDDYYDGSMMQQF